MTAALSVALGVESAVLPMSDDPVSTILETPEGRLEFQEYFVRRGQRGRGARGRACAASRTPGRRRAVLAAISGADAIVFCPSNPVVSVGPILALPGMREALASSRAPKVAVSPIVGGRALKGPADKMLALARPRGLGHGRGQDVLLAWWTGWSSIEIDESERAGIEALGMRVLVTESVMRDAEDRARLASETLEFGAGMVAR